MMMDIREPVFRWGEPVAAIGNIVNDGSFPHAAPDALLVTAGARGEVVNVGHHEEGNVPVYLVEFAGYDGQPIVVGCFEEELARADALVGGGQG